jgi:prepilin-type processing-associated H-X9-DG protein/prepilin-type N-terminal cleavage/methylation domain-containing protein
MIMVFVQTNTSDRGHRSRPLKPAFTLVELLVVIGIIALLIAILLPALAAARQTAQRAACAAKLQQIMIAANIHAVDHKGYWPLAGFLYGSGSLTGPAGLGDAYTSHYSYFGFQDIAASNGGDERILASITIALGSEMGYPKLLTYDTNAQEGPALADHNGVMRHFLCPSQASSPEELQQLCWLYAGQFNGTYGVGDTAQLSYVFNEGVLGFNDNFGRLRGQVARIKQPSKTFFAADGLAGSPGSRTTANWTSISNPPQNFPPPWGFATIYNSQPVTANWSGGISLNDCLAVRTNPKTGTKLGGDAVSFDVIRHRRKMNIAFCDGHVESRDIPDLVKNPANTGLSDVYILAP